MMVLITFDILIANKKDQKRAELIIKKCRNHGQRVQQSVFECLIDPATLAVLKKELGDMIDMTTDTVRFYSLGSNWKERIDSIGADRMYDPEGPLII